MNLFLVCCECGNECVRVCARKPGCVTLGCVCMYAHRSGEMCSCVSRMFVSGCECVLSVGGSFVGLRCLVVGPQPHRCGHPQVCVRARRCQCVFVCLGVGVAPPISPELVMGPQPSVSECLQPSAQGL